MRRFIRGILHPEGFHGHGDGAPFFEGWYVKLVTADETRSLALIPGVFRGTERGSAHAFLQVVDPRDRWVRYETFSISELFGGDAAFDVALGENRFHAGGLRLALPHLSGEVRFGPMSPWPVTWASPGVMGWYAWVPTMPCYHGIVSLDHALDGALEVGGERLDFTGGRGYIEKDWGRSFPKRWIWLQSNHFDEPGDCVTASIADVPWIRGSFPGFLVGVWVGGQLYRLTTYTGARVVRASREADGVAVTVEDRTRRLELRARGGRPVGIHVPTRESMRGAVHEHLDATLEVRLSERGGAVLFEGTGRQAAWEAQGAVEGLGAATRERRRQSA